MATESEFCINALNINLHCNAGESVFYLIQCKSRLSQHKHTYVWKLNEYI